MFRCQLTGELSDKGEKPVTVVVERRKKEYFGYRKNRDRTETYEKVAEGWEIVKEIRVRQKNLDKVKS